MPSPAPITMPLAIAAGRPRGMLGLSRKYTPTGAATPRIAGAIKNKPGSLILASAPNQTPIPTPYTAAVLYRTVISLPLRLLDGGATYAVCGKGCCGTPACGNGCCGKGCCGTPACGTGCCGKGAACAKSAR